MHRFQEQVQELYETRRQQSHAQVSSWLFGALCVSEAARVPFGQGGAPMLLPVLGANAVLVFRFRDHVVTRHALCLGLAASAAAFGPRLPYGLDPGLAAFVPLALSAAYRDWRVLLSASLGYVAAALFHGGLPPSRLAWVAVSDAFLALACVQASRADLELARRESYIQGLNGTIERLMASRAAELEDTQAQLAQAQKLEAVGQLASGIAHDFNNVLAGIMAYTSVLKDSVENNPLMTRGLQVIESSAERGADLVRKLMTFARKGVVERKVLDVDRVLGDVLALFSPTLEGRIEVESESDAEPWQIEGDSNQLFQIIMNLAVNAKDAMPAGGKLRFAIRNLGAEQITCLAKRELSASAYVCLVVQDSGTGIPVEIRDKIFDPFFTTKEKGKGTGLGLAMVYGIVKNHGGAISLESEPGQGTTFRVYFPALERKPAASAPAVSDATPGMAAEPPSFRGQQILLVDDEALVRTASAEVLRGAGAEVRLASNGEEALEMFEKEPERFGVVILDVVMPKMGGVEALARMYAINPRVTFVLASGYSESPEVAAIRAKVPARFLQKPFKGEHFVREILRKTA